MGTCWYAFSQDEQTLFLTETISKLQNIATKKEMENAVQEILYATPETNHREVKIVQKVLLAALYARSVDNLNKESTNGYQQACEDVAKINNIPLQIWVNTQAGFYFYSYSRYVKALPFFLKSSRAIDMYPAIRLLQDCDVLKKNAYFFGSVKEHEKSIAYLHKALLVAPVESEDYGALLNAIGNSYLERGKLTDAETYFLKTRQNALENKDEMRFAKALGDLARINIKQKNWNKAENLLVEDIAVSEKNNSHRNTMFARIQLGKMYWEKGDTARAYTVLTQAQHYAAGKAYLKGFDQEISEILLHIAIKNKDNAAELNLRRKLDTLNSQVARTEGKEAINEIIRQTEKEKGQWQLETERTRAEKASVLKWTFLFTSLLLLLLIVMVLVMYKRKMKWQQTTYERKLLSFQLDKMRSEKKLSETNNSLESYKIYLKEKKRQINDLEREINEMKHSSSAFLENEAGVLQQLLSSHLMTDENWKQFKYTFIKEQPLYYENLVKCFPDLTESNLRILLLHKVGLNNQEMAQILGVTLDAVKKAKQRLRKKYDKAFEAFEY